MSASELREWVEEVTRVLLVDSVLEQVEALIKGALYRREAKQKREGG